MIDALIILTKLILCAAVLAIAALSYLRGVRHGVDIIARVELDEWEAGIGAAPSEYAAYVRERRQAVRAEDNEKVYQMWRRAQGLKDGAATRELFNDKEYRNQLEAQKHVG